ncbi:uncharacterized protein LOC126965119 isoform X2 [Leptidea sinapis]|uniref:uncharacterized protein LOC126965119 isoform X2 n=1 Tax=Leptidea sinapis TaxID=189913 RepID=UPI0021C2EE79|nr:uncharacterized protein LOC126965119 isoform X2 [Leptidea sinapis]
MKYILNSFNSGNGAQNEVAYNPTTVNGTSQGTMWSGAQRENEIALRLPRALDIDDIIHVSGQLKSNPEKFCVALTSGNYDNIAAEVEAQFSQEDKIILRTSVNGFIEENDVERVKASDFFPSTDFSIRFVIKPQDESIIDIYVGESALDSISLKHNMGQITHLTLSHDIRRVDELSFKFA